MPKFKINFDWLKATLTLGLIAFVVLFSLQQLMLYVQTPVINTGIVAIVITLNVWIGKLAANWASNKIFHPPSKKKKEEKKKEDDPPKEPQIDLDAIKKDLLVEFNFSDELKRLSNCEVNYLKKLIDEVAKKSSAKAEFNANKGFSDKQKNDKDALETKVKGWLFFLFLLGNLSLTSVICILFYFKEIVSYMKVIFYLLRLQIGI